MPLAQDLLGPDAANDLDLKKLSQALLMQKIGGPQHTTVVDFGEDAKQARRDARRDALYEKLLNTSFQPDKKAAMAMGIVKALSNLSYLGGEAAGEAGTARAQELSSSMNQAARQNAQDESKLGTRLLGLEDADIARYKSRGPAPDDTFKTLGAINQVRGLNAADQRQKDLQDFRSKSLAQKTAEKRGEPSKDEVDARKAFTRTKELLYNGPRGRVMTIQSLLEKQIDRDLTLTDMIGAPPDQTQTWRPPKNETDAQMEQRLNKGTPQQLNMMVNALASVVGTGVSAQQTSDFKFKEFNAQTFMADYANFKQKWGNEPAPAAAGKFLAKYVNILKKEKITIGTDLRRSVKGLTNDPRYKKHFPDELQQVYDDFGFVPENESGGQAGPKDPADMTKDELDAEAKRLGVQ